jgi:hypothetical protein
MPMGCRFRLLLACCALACALLPAHHAFAAPDFNDPQVQGRAQDYMNFRINELRAANGAGPVRFDPVACQAAQLHAKDMLQRGYFSHWNPEGLKPTRRYNLIGGFHALGENIYFLHGEFGSVEGIVDEALAKLMDSEGHRKTLINPSYTHVGIYIAADARRGDLYVAQEFIARLGGEYRCPLYASVGQMIEFAGRYDQYRYDFENIIIGYEDRPRQRDLLWLSQTGSYRDGDKLVAGYTANPRLEFKELPTFREVEVNADEGWFKSGLRLSYKGREGLYYVFLWLRDKRSGQPVLAATVSVDVTLP